jgi:hypothetical protein
MIEDVTAPEIYSLIDWAKEKGDMGDLFIGSKKEGRDDNMM